MALWIFSGDNGEVFVVGSEVNTAEFGNKAEHNAEEIRSLRNGALGVGDTKLYTSSSTDEAWVRKKWTTLNPTLLSVLFETHKDAVPTTC